MRIHTQTGRRSLIRLLALSLALAACSGGATPTEAVSAPPTPDPAAEVQTILSAYFAALHEGRYEEAAAVYGGSYDTLQANNPDVDPANEALLLERWCTMNGGVCLPILSVLRYEQISPESFTFIVQFAKEDGGLFEIGPCCGEPDTGQRTTDFSYTVQRIGGTFKVIELPPYIP